MDGMPGRHGYGERAGLVGADQPAVLMPSASMN